jgi:FHA domain
MVVPAASAALVADNGARTPLDRDYVFGREPWNDQAVIDGHASPIVVRDPDNLVSRIQVHVTVRPSDGIVVIRDVSANGTFVAPPGGAEWMRLTREPVSLPPGWSILMGSRIFTYTGPG